MVVVGLWGWMGGCRLVGRTGRGFEEWEIARRGAGC